jgi:hypothetical protein
VNGTGEYNRQIEGSAQESYPQTAPLNQVKGVSTLIASIYMLPPVDPQNFCKSPDVGYFVRSLCFVKSFCTNLGPSFL